MFHGRPIFLPFSWPLGACDALLAKNASPCVAERLGVTSGATFGATCLEKIASDYQIVKCQV